MNYKHGLTHTKIYSVLCRMKERCYNIKSKDYKNYGLRGIIICDEWLKSPQSFFDWAISNGYKENLTIDRIDVNGNYEPNNCRWITKKQQNNNRRTNKFITYNNETHTLAEWSEIVNIKYKVLHKRIKYFNWNIEKAFNTPVKIYKY